MGKGRKTAKELAAIIKQQLNFGGIFIKVMQDPASGWRAGAMVEPAKAITVSAKARAVQAEVEDIVAVLRVHFDLINS